MNVGKKQIRLPILRLEDTASQNEHSYIYREGGFRLQQQSYNGKQIFHNYGQGKAQFSISYGCAYLASKIITVKQDASKIKEVCVIGSGINAYMTTLQLLKRGYKVYFYTKKIPSKIALKNEKIDQNHAEMIFWYPGGYDNCDPLKHQLISKLSFQYFKECLMANRYQSLRWVNCYCLGTKGDELKENVTEYINNQVKQVQLQFGIQKMESAISYKTILISTQLFMEEIFTELKLRNAVIIQKQFKEPQDILSLKQKYIFNCLQEENKIIFNDACIYPIKNIYYQMKVNSKSSPENLAIWVGSDIEKEDFVVIVNGNNMQVSGEQNQDKKDINKKILTRAYHFLRSKTTKPYKL